ncbi:MAG: AAA family ATPase [Candidatus Lokiarchaeota archaeon]|nr:AAA family ATPase [Candidatus Lokiarchaeota archaeon]
MFHKKNDNGKLRENQNRSAKLRIERLESSRSGRSLCYIDQDVLEKIGLSTGDIIEIIGRKRTAGIVVVDSVDRGKNSIKIDGIQRQNLGSTIGEIVTVLPSIASPAREIELASTKPLYDIKKQADIIKGKLIDKPITTGDIIDVPGAFIQVEEDNNPVIGSMRMFAGRTRVRKPSVGPLKLIVLKTKPRDEVIRFTRDTRIKINKKIVYLNYEGIILSYEDIIGLNDEIAEIKKALELSFTYPSFYIKSGINPPKGILLVGPSGVGKTLLAKVIANETNYNFMHVSITDIFQKYQGDSEKRLKQLFEAAENDAPCLIFIDHIESFAPQIQKGMISNAWYFEHRMVTLLMELMDGMYEYKNVIILGTTHKYDLIEPALLRPGRFDIIIHLSLPDVSSREKIYQLYTKDLIIDDEVSLSQLSEISVNFTGADIKGVVRLAMINAAKRESLELQNELDEISTEILGNIKLKKQDFLSAIEEITRRFNN